MIIDGWGRVLLRQMIYMIVIVNIVQQSLFVFCTKNLRL